MGSTCLSQPSNPVSSACGGACCLAGDKVLVALAVEDVEELDVDMAPAARPRQTLRLITSLFGFSGLTTFVWQVGVDYAPTLSWFWSCCWSPVFCTLVAALLVLVLAFSSFVHNACAHTAAFLSIRNKEGTWARAGYWTLLKARLCARPLSGGLEPKHFEEYCF